MTATDKASRKVIWRPQPGPQVMACACPADEIFFGGARGGGKTDAALGRQIDGALQYGHAWSGLMIRKKYKQFNELRRRVDELIRDGLPAKRTGGDQQTNTIDFSNGARITLTVVQRADQLGDYQGAQHTEVSIEEATNFAYLDEMIDQMRGCLRSPHGVPCAMFLTGNPGGPGHTQVKARYIDAAPPMTPIRDEATGSVRVYIPSRVWDNRILCDADPVYVQRLRSIRDPVLRRAWLEGDWDVVVGGFFGDAWQRDKHVIPALQPPIAWQRLCGFDWGSARPFSVGWYAVSDGTEIPGWPGPILPRGAVVRYAEWYGCLPGQANRGLRLPSSAVAAGILDREAGRGEGSIPFDRVADPAIFASTDGPSTAQRMSDATGGRLRWRRGDNRRVPGWDACMSRLRGFDDSEGQPMFYVTEDCTEFIRTIPTLERHETDWEDIDTEQEDHVADEWRYVMTAAHGQQLLFPGLAAA